MTTMRSFAATMTNRYYSDNPTTQPDDVIATCTLIEVASANPAALKSTLNLTMTRAQADLMRYDRIYNITVDEAGAPEPEVPELLRATASDAIEPEAP